MAIAARLLAAAAALSLAAPTVALEQAEARHLLSRTGFGPTPDEIAALLPLTREQAVDALLDGVRREPFVTPPAWCAISLADNARQRNDEERAWRELEREEREKKQQARDRRDRDRGVELKAWWYREMAATPSPLTERLVLLWHNHFTSALATVYDPVLMHEQNRLFREHALGNFGELLKAMPADPAMFIYLDSNSNSAGRPNENFAREVMELFTVGEGHYTEADIKEAARALTGYKIDLDTGRPALSDNHHDTGWKTVLGNKGVWNADSVMGILMEREERVAIHLAEKMWREFIAEDIAEKTAPKGTAKEIYKLAAVFYKGKYDLRRLVRATLLHARFWEPAVRGTLVRGPVELLAGTVRQLDLPVPDARKLVDMGRGLGQDLLDPPNVKGWPGGSAWISTHGMLARRETLSAIAGGALGNPNGRGTRADRAAAAVGDAMAPAGDAMAPAAPAAGAPAAKPPGPDRGRWIPEARKQGADGVALATALLLPIPPVKPPTATSLDEAIGQLLLDPAYHLK